MARKGSSKKRTVRRRKLRGGFYGAKGAIAPGAMEWGRGTEMGAFVANSSRGQNAILGAGRRRKSKKTRRHRKHRGGDKFGTVSAGFLGDGSAGIRNVHGVTTNHNLNNSAKFGAFNDHGAKSMSDNKSFIRVL